PVTCTRAVRRSIFQPLQRTGLQMDLWDQLSSGVAMPGIGSWFGRDGGNSLAVIRPVQCSRMRIQPAGVDARLRNSWEERRTYMPCLGKVVSARVYWARSNAVGSAQFF